MRRVTFPAPETSNFLLSVQLSTILRSKRFRGVGEQRKTEERDFLCFTRAKNGEQGWRSGENARLPPVCPGFDSRTRRHMWVEFVSARALEDWHLNKVIIIIAKHRNAREGEGKEGKAARQTPGFWKPPTWPFMTQCADWDLMLSSVERWTLNVEDLSKYIRNNELTERRNLNESERLMQALKL